MGIMGQVFSCGRAPNLTCELPKTNGRVEVEFENYEINRWSKGGASWLPTSDHKFTREGRKLTINLLRGTPDAVTRVGCTILVDGRMWKEGVFHRNHTGRLCTTATGSSSVCI